MVGALRYRLGLDIGSTSIGGCMLRLNKEEPFRPIALIKMGVRIFSAGRNLKDGSSLAVTRRQARQMRRRRDRLLKRKARLMNALIRLASWHYLREARSTFFSLPTSSTKRSSAFMENPNSRARKIPISSISFD